MILMFLSRKKYITNILSACFLLFCIVGISALLTGCGATRYETNTLVLGKDGGVTEYLSEEFPIDLYDIDEWKSECNDQIDSCNKASGDEVVKLKDVELSDSILRCSIEYRDDDAYYDFNGIALFYGTIGQAVKAGYSLMVPVVSAEDGTAISSDELARMTDSHILIYSEPVDIVTYKKIDYISNAVSVSEDRKAASIDGDGTGYIVFD